MASVTSHSQKNKSSLSLNNHHLNNSINSEKLRNDTPQSIPLADLDGEMQISNLSLASSKSYSKSLQSIQSYNGSIKVRNFQIHIFLEYVCRLASAWLESFSQVGVSKLIFILECYFKRTFFVNFNFFEHFYFLKVPAIFGPKTYVLFLAPAIPKS